tara:strand:+ start:8989 stop:9705 length:717 start_codon:yes stop_codon:yes gene_type:complete
MNDETKGCPRCSDYDKVKQELENNKSNREKETRDALKQCKQSKVKLQKKLLTFGAIAVVAGTILGKDFIDTIANYIKSFNDVKNNATKLISSTDAPVIEVVRNEEKPEEKKENESISDNDWYPSLGLVPAMPIRNFSTNLPSTMSISDVLTLTTIASTPNDTFTMTYDDMPVFMSAERINELTAFSQTFDPEVQFEFYGDLEIYRTMQAPEAPAIVPSPSTLTLLLLGNALSNSRSRM